MHAHQASHGNQNKIKTYLEGALFTYLYMSGLAVIQKANIGEFEIGLFFILHPVLMPIWLLTIECAGNQDQAEHVKGKTKESYVNRNGSIIAIAALGTTRSHTRTGSK